MNNELKTIKSKLEPCVLPHLYQYIQPAGNAQCVFFEIYNELNYDGGDCDKANEQTMKEVNNTLATIYGREEFTAFHTISYLFSSIEESAAIHSKILEKWEQKANDYVSDYIADYDTNIKNGFFFMFLPNKL
jgi:hypothetical protein